MVIRGYIHQYTIFPFIFYVPMFCFSLIMLTKVEDAPAEPVSQAPAKPEPKFVTWTLINADVDKTKLLIFNNY